MYVLHYVRYLKLVFYTLHRSWGTCPLSRWSCCDSYPDFSTPKSHSLYLYCDAGCGPLWSLSLTDADGLYREPRRDYSLKREADSILLGLTLTESLTSSIDGNNYGLAQIFCFRSPVISLIRTYSSNSQTSCPAFPGGFRSGGGLLSPWTMDEPTFSPPA